MTIWWLKSPEQSEGFQLRIFLSCTGLYHKIRELEFKEHTLDTRFNLLSLGRKVNSLPFLFFPAHVILFSASVLEYNQLLPIPTEPHNTHCTD